MQESSYQHLWEDMGVVRVFEGPLTEQILEEATLALQAHPRFDYLRYLIMDCRHCSIVELSHTVLVELAARTSAANHRKRLYRVAIVSSSPKSHELVEMVERYAFDRLQYQCFPTMEAARDWVSEFSPGAPSSSSEPPAD